MFKQFGFFIHLTIFSAIFAFGNASIYAQNAEAPPPPPPIIRAEGSGIGSGYGIANGNDEDDDTKVTGATVRGRIFYEDTSRPVRFASLTLMPDSSENFVNKYTLKYVKTDENGEFIIKNVKPGTYLPFIKSEGILTPEVVRKTEKDASDQPFFEKVTVSGLGEIQIAIRAKRGGAVSGRVQYADGEAAVGVKVEILKKQGERYENVSINYGERTVGNAETDDRGVYRLAGLPAGTYVVRVNEPFSHSQSKSQYGYETQNQNSILKTYYPEGENPKTATELEITLGQEQSDINISLPERQLFTLTGKIVSKKNKQPLENFSVRFFKVAENEAISIQSFSLGNSVNVNKLGDWALKNLPKGKYRVTASQTYVYRPKEQTEKIPDYPSVSKEIEITDQNIDYLIFEIPTASSLSGVMVMEDGKAIPKYLSVTAIDEKSKEIFGSGFDPSEQEEKQPGKPREFKIGKMTGGKYDLFVNNREAYVKSITFNGRDVTSSGIEIGEGEDLSGLRIVLASDFGTIKGRVNNFEEGGGRIFAIALKSDFQIQQLRANSFSGIVGANGEFEIKAKSGDYVVILLSDKTRPKNETELAEIFKNLVQNAPKVTVKSNEIFNVTVEMPK